MRLAVQVLGDEERTAVLIHGLMSDHRAWHRVVAHLRDAGYRVVTLDLAGHGASPRSPRYSPRAWADDVVESLEPVLDGPPDLLMGHSLGALVAGLVSERYPPRVAVYVDPAFAFPRGPHGAGLKAVFALSPKPTAWILRWLNPRWSHEDVALEVATVGLWDRRTLLGFTSTRDLVPPRDPGSSTLVVLAERSLLITARAADRLRGLGMTVETIRGAGHTVFRDEHDTFVELLDAWLVRHAPDPVVG